MFQHSRFEWETPILKRELLSSRPFLKWAILEKNETGGAGGVCEDMEFAEVSSKKRVELPWHGLIKNGVKFPWVTKKK